MKGICKYGEPYLGDTKFVAECRLLQSIYRTEIGENIRPYASKDRLYFFGNYIEAGEESGANFLARYIFDYAEFLFAHTECEMLNLIDCYSEYYKILPKDKSSFGGDRQGTAFLQRNQ